MGNGNGITVSGNGNGTVVDYAKNAEMVDLVKKMVFPDATAAELTMFFHKCASAGVSPLDRKFYPIKYGGKLTFVTSIDYMRSRAVASGVFDGVDDIEYETDDDTDGHPSEAVCRVYRKDISRPFIGRARWDEFCPASNPQWKSKPYLMLGKCAEAQAYRKAFPDEFDKLYVSEEFDAADEPRNAKSAKPKITAADVVVVEDAVPLDSLAAPQGKPVAQKQGGGEFRGTVDDVVPKEGESNGKAWVKYGVKINNVYYSTFSADLGAKAENLKGQPVVYTFEREGKYNNLLTIELDAPEGV